jgi:hypothetical protein
MQIAGIAAEVDTVIAACGGIARATIRALLIADEDLNAELERLRSVGRIRERADQITENYLKRSMI